MIEIRNIKVFADEKSRNRGDFYRCHHCATVTCASILELEDEDGDFIVKINMKNSRNFVAIFDSIEKSSSFYDALKKILPDSDDKNNVIDCKDFE